MIDKGQLWTVIVLLGVGSFGLRYVFLGLVGNRPLPPWILRHLRYTAVSVLPALIAPLVLWPPATGGETEPVRLMAALAAVGAGLLTRNVIASILLGAGVLVLGLNFWG